MITETNSYYDQDQRNNTAGELNKESFEDENKIQEQSAEYNVFYSTQADTDASESSDYLDSEFSNELENDDQDDLEQDYDQSDLEQDVEEDDIDDDDYDDDDEIEPETFADDSQKID